MNYGDAGIGGPVFIPKLFDGRNKLFFFVGVLVESPNNASSNTIAVPTTKITPATSAISRLRHILPAVPLTLPLHKLCSRVPGATPRCLTITVSTRPTIRIR